MKLRILVVDDDELIRRLLRETLGEKYQVHTAGDGQTALRLAREIPFDLVLCDIRMTGLNGFDVLHAFKQELNSKAEIVMMTGFGGLDAVMRATQGGAIDFIAKPFDLERILRLAGAVASRLSFKQEAAAAQSEAERPEAITGEIVGGSPVMIELFKSVARVAATDLTVTIYGESGTGKELIARTIHQHSSRASRPFVAVNCGALTETLLESELFGHQRGAFTGAIAAHRGLFEEADGGTIFLDEIGETSLAFQVRLLRVLQEGEIKPVGSNRVVRVSARVITASNRNLKQAVNDGLFRQDLLYRINAMTLELPPLRERREDIPLLIQRFVSEAAGMARGATAGSGHNSARTARQIEFTPAAIERLCACAWPGNVRQLQNTIHRLVALCASGVIHESDLPPELSQPEETALPVELGNSSEDLITFQELERRYLIRVLGATSGNKVQAARILNIDRKTVDRMMRTHGIESECFKQS
jgi:DNA-binding NtrC family response regulator